VGVDTEGEAPSPLAREGEAHAEHGERERCVSGGDGHDDVRRAEQPRHRPFEHMLRPQRGLLEKLAARGVVGPCEVAQVVQRVGVERLELTHLPRVIGAWMVGGQGMEVGGVPWWGWGLAHFLRSEGGMG
jgi:hypothetical protein